MGFSKIVRLLPLAGFAAVSVSAQAAEPLTLAPAEPLVMAPSSTWIADYSEDNCALRRSFAAGGDNAVLQLRQYIPGNTFEVSVASDTLSRSREDPEVRFEPDDHWYVVRSALSISQDRARGIQYSDTLKRNVDKGEPSWSEADREARERAITALTVKKAFQRDIVLSTGAMRRAMEALRTCTDAMLVRWGLDPAAQRMLSRGVAPLDMANWVRKIQQYYPATRFGENGRVHVRMIVGPDGMPVSCAARTGKGDLAFERAACSTMMDYSRFQPALDASGAPVASYYATTVIYVSAG